MSESELIRRLRRNLPRSYGIKVMYAGYPLLGLRIPRESVSELSKDDTEILYGQLYSNREQIRPSEIEEVYIVADSDFMQVDADSFFRPILGISDSSASFLIKNTQENVPQGDAVILPEEQAEPDISLVDNVIPENAFVSESVTSSYDVDSRKSAFEGMPGFEANSPEKKEKKEELIISDDSPIFRFKEATTESPAKLCLYEPEICVELIPREYVPILGHDELEEELKDSSRHIEKTASEQLLEDLKEDRTVGKILNDFARNSQKKRLATGRLKSGRRAEVLTKSKRGRYVRYRMPGEKITDIAIAPTVRAAAHHAKDGKIEIQKGDLREKVRRRRISSLINIVFDTSGSMDEHEKIQITTSVVLALLKDAYQRRDRVSLVTYSGRSGELVLPFTSSVEAAKRYLEKVPFGGTTPMASGLLRGLDTLLREVKKEPSAVPIMILVTDGTANSPLHLGGNIRREIRQVCRQIAEYHINLLVVDISDNGSVLAKEVAMQSNGNYYHPKSLSREALYSAITQERDQKTDFALV